jgi:hypothetical protein
LDQKTNLPGLLGTVSVITHEPMDLIFTFRSHTSGMRDKYALTKIFLTFRSHTSGMRDKYALTKIFLTFRSHTSGILKYSCEKSSVYEIFSWYPGSSRACGAPFCRGLQQHRRGSGDPGTYSTTDTGPDTGCSDHPPPDDRHRWIDTARAHPDDPCLRSSLDLD